MDTNRQTDDYKQTKSTESTQRKSLKKELTCNNTNNNNNNRPRDWICKELKGMREDGVGGCGSYRLHVG